MIKHSDRALENVDLMFMQEALKQAQIAAQHDEVPVGAVITLDNKIIARSYNQVETLKDPTAHAEMIALTQATNHLRRKWLHNCTLYVTIEPCSMCAGALVLSRIKRIVYGAKDPKTGACGTVMNIAHNAKLNHAIDITEGVMPQECGDIITQFFRKKRAKV